VARAALARRGVALVLDFVPNHVAPDHPWAESTPEMFVAGTTDDLHADPNRFVATPTGTVVARGRDPYFPPWPDVAQLDVFSPLTRAAAADTLAEIAAQCDVVRCDMAMLALSEVFGATWGRPAPPTEYWADVFDVARHRFPHLAFWAEVYWGMEDRLLALGFDACYDKVLYDRLTADDPAGVRTHLAGLAGNGARMIRFTENHDEPRAAAAFGPAARAAAVAVATLPGTTLWHDGQFEGRCVHVPVQVGRRPTEPIDEQARAFHHRLVHLARRIRSGTWTLAPVDGWPDDGSADRLLAWTWAGCDRRHVIVVNLTGERATGRVRLPWSPPDGWTGVCEDLLSGQRYEHDPAVVGAEGLFVDLDGRGFHVLTCG